MHGRSKRFRACKQIVFDIAQAVAAYPWCGHKLFERKQLF